MSEFYFDYKCVPMGKKDSGNDRALDFFLYQNYSINGDMAVQVRIPREMQKKYSGVKIYNQTGAVETPEDIGGLDYEYIPCEKDGQPHEYLISDENCIIIKGDEGELSGRGVLAFVKSPDQEPLIEDTYRYSINYTKKDMIFYKVIEQKNWLSVQICYNILRKDMHLAMVRKSGSKPILVKDYTPDKYEKDGDKTIIITLPAKSKKNNRVSKLLKTNRINMDDFRLTFVDPADSLYYMLVDDSDFTYEDKSDRRTEINTRVPKNDNSVHYCPYCGNEIKINKEHRPGTIATCSGEILDVKVPKQLEGRRVTVCGADLVEDSNKEIPVNRLILPEGCTSQPSMNVVVAGHPESGKTIFLSSLFNMKGKGDEHIFSNAQILSKIAEAYGKKKDRAVTQVRYDNIEIQGGSGVLSDRCERMRTESPGRYLMRYLMNVGGSIESHTKGVEAEAMSWHPIGFRVGSLGFVHFYDVPGEIFTNVFSGKVRSMDMADCFIAVIDGDKPPEVALSNTKNSLDRIKSLSGKNIDFKTIPIAIVLTKHDLRLTDCNEDDQISQANCFDPNCHVTIEDMTALMSGSKRYHNSEIELHIERSNYEMMHFLKSGSSESAEFYDEIKKTYGNIKFFTCSALGKKDSLSESEREIKEVLYKPRRLRMELPIIWLMYQKGLIRR